MMACLAWITAKMRFSQCSLTAVGGEMCEIAGKCDDVEFTE